MPRLRYYKMTARDGTPLRIHTVVPTAASQEAMFRRWQAWRSRADDAPLPDFIKPEDERDYRDFLRKQTGEPEPPKTTGAVLVIERIDA